MESKKYELVKDDFIIVEGKIKLYRIKALKEFNNVELGELGGYIEKEENLSHYGHCWVYGDARVFEEARVYHNACVMDSSSVYGHAHIYGGATLLEDAIVRDNAQVGDNTWVTGDALVEGYARVANRAYLTSQAVVSGYAMVRDSAHISGTAVVTGDSNVFGRAEISGDAIVRSKDDYIVFKNNWSSERYFTWTKSNDMWKVGCFYGTGEDLVEKAYKDGQLSGACYEAYVNLVKTIEREKSK